MRATLIMVLSIALSLSVLAQDVSSTKRVDQFCAVDVEYLFRSTTTRSDITLRIQFQGTPQTNIEVRLRRHDALKKSNQPLPPLVLRASTDAAGRASFSNIPEGKYSVEIGEALWPADEVVADGAAESSEEVEIEWPQTSETSHDLRGKVLDSKTQQLTSNLTVKVIAPRTGKVLASSVTNASGEYQFDHFADGAYAVRFFSNNSKLGWADYGVELNSASRQNTVSDIHFQSDDCGTYAFPAKQP